MLAKNICKIIFKYTGDEKKIIIRNDKKFYRHPTYKKICL